MSRMLCIGAALIAGLPAVAEPDPGAEPLAAAMLQTRKDISAATEALNQWREAKKLIGAMSSRRDLSRLFR